MKISQQIQGLRNATGMRNPMERDDYRQPMRRAMLVDARRALLDAHGCPPIMAGGLAMQPMAQWPEKARAKVAGR